MNIELYDNLVKTSMNTAEDCIEDRLGDALAKLELGMANLKEHWEGSDRDFFVEKMTPYINDLYKLQECLRSYHAFVTGYVEAELALNEYYKDLTVTLR